MALWDYQAEDDDEITFDPGEIITDIEQIDEVRHIAPHFQGSAQINYFISLILFSYVFSIRPITYQS